MLQTGHAVDGGLCAELTLDRIAAPDANSRQAPKDVGAALDKLDRIKPGRAKGRVMRATKLVGPEAASQKYDILTALGCHALCGPAGLQRLVLRFLTLVTARYNWRAGQFHVGQREIARLWSVDERTVKREMARLRNLGWIILESPARRGRVATYTLDLTAIRAATRADWRRVGEDFEARMGGGGPAAGGTVVPFPGPDLGRGPTDDDAGEEDAAPEDGWPRMRQMLQEADAVVFASWFDALKSRGGAGEALVLVAPSAFHASYVRTHYAERLAAVARRACGIETLRIVTAAEVAG